MNNNWISYKTAKGGESDGKEAEKEQFIWVGNIGWID